MNGFRIHQKTDLGAPQAGDLFIVERAGVLKKADFVNFSAGEAYNVVAHGAKPGGVIDATAGFIAAQAARDAAGGGAITVPSGTYLVNEFVLKGTGDLEATGQHASVLIGDLAAAFVLQLGAHSGAGTTQFKGKVSRLRITRAAGAVPAGSIGISLKSFSKSVLEDMVVDRHGAGIKTSDGWISADLGLDLNRVHTYNCTIHHWLKDVAQVSMTTMECGLNGGEDVPPSVLVQFDGLTNGVQINKMQFIPRVSASTAVAFNWINNAADNSGTVKLYDINIENLATGFRSEASALCVTNLNVSGSRLTPNGKLFDFNAATALVNLAFVDNDSIKSGAACTLTGARLSRFCLNQMEGQITFAGGQWTVTGNDFSNDIYFTGVFSKLVHKDNWYGFDGTIPIRPHVTGTGTFPGCVQDGPNVFDYVDLDHPQQTWSTNTMFALPLAEGVNLKTLTGYFVFKVPAGKKFIFTGGSAELTAVTGYNAAVLPALVIDTGAGSDFLAVGTADSSWNAVGRALPLLPLAGGTYRVATAGQTIRVLNNAANTSTALTATVHIFGFLVDA